MKVRRYDRQLRDPDLRPLWRYIVTRAMDRALAKFGGVAPTSDAALGIRLPWWIRRASKSGIRKAVEGAIHEGLPGIHERPRTDRS